MIASKKREIIKVKIIEIVSNDVSNARSFDDESGILILEDFLDLVGMQYQWVF